MGTNKKIVIKTDGEIERMVEGGKKLFKIKEQLKKLIKEGRNAAEVEKLACKLIKKESGKASFKMVEGYNWATCVNINEGVVHGIPHKNLVFKKGDLVSVDIGIFWKGFHTDSSFSMVVGTDKKVNEFLEIGEKAIRNAVSQAKAGNRIYDISEAIESVVKAAGYEPIRSLVGHGVGRELHEPPQIPGFTHGNRADSPKIEPGMALAIEVMYAQGKPDVKVAGDGWTIAASDGTITALFEETIAVTKKGTKVLTNDNFFKAN